MLRSNAEYPNFTSFFRKQTSELTQEISLDKPQELSRLKRNILSLHSTQIYTITISMK